MLDDLFDIQELFFQYGRYIIEITILYILFRYKFKRSSTDLQLSPATIEKLISDFKPEKLVEVIDPEHLEEPEFIGSNLIEAADYDFYGLKDKNKDEMIATIREYGVGTCGPPGFYGTLDIHLQLEAKISQVLGTEASILYSNSFTCINSVITCFCRQHDNVFYHKDCNEAIIRALGIIKGGSTLYSDLSDLEEKIKKHYEKGKRNFIITEGLFRNTGEIVDLPRLIQMKNKHKARLIIDESLSIPLLGVKGLSGFFNSDIQEIDIIIGSLAHVFCGNGGFASGNRFVTDYQRLSAPSYCFSASMPGFLAINAMLNIVRNYQKINVDKFHKEFVSEKFAIVSDPKSPMVIISKVDIDINCNFNEELKELRAIRLKLLEEGIRIGIIENPLPSFRVCLKQEFQSRILKKIAHKIAEVINK